MLLLVALHSVSKKNELYSELVSCDLKETLNCIWNVKAEAEEKQMKALEAQALLREVGLEKTFFKKKTWQELQKCKESAEEGQKRSQEDENKIWVLSLIEGEHEAQEIGVLFDGGWKSDAVLIILIQIFQIHIFD